MSVGSNAPTTPALVIHIPHASIDVPLSIRQTFALDEAELADELRRMTDRFTDELFAFPDSDATTVAASVSRLVVDVERFPNDEDESMAAVGMGAVYTRTSLGAALRNGVIEREELVERYYRPHHDRLLSAVRDALSVHDVCLLVDAHSFSSTPLPHEPDQQPDRPDICIGTDALHTPDWLRNRAVELARDAGWSVEVNRPFSGAVVPLPLYGSDLRIAAVMIEVNRALYMDERSGAQSPQFASVRQRLVQIVDGLVDSVGTRPEHLDAAAR